MVDSTRPPPAPVGIYEPFVLCGNQLALSAISDEERIEQFLFVRGFVNACDDFPSVHKVIDAASKVIIARLGEKGRHARTALGCATLPNNNAVTLEAMVVVLPQ